MGTGIISYEKSRMLLYLPFAGITLFRFNGFYLSFLKHPEDGAKLAVFFHMDNCNFISPFTLYIKIKLNEKVTFNSNDAVFRFFNGATKFKCTSR
jgi:hypothetical protein